MERKRVFITGLGFISSIGNDVASVGNSLRALKHGFTRYAPISDDPLSEINLVSAPSEFDVDSADFEDWTYPDRFRVRREVLRGFAPHGLYVYCSMIQAIENAGLDQEDVSNEFTGIYTASGGSPRQIYRNTARMHEFGPMRCPPTGIVSSISGTLSFNLVACFKMR
jgi:3-oxoacyl-[acyl-carrier-protein] synthase-1